MKRQIPNRTMLNISKEPEKSGKIDTPGDFCSLNIQSNEKTQKEILLEKRAKLIYELQSIDYRLNHL